MDQIHFKKGSFLSPMTKVKILLERTQKLCHPWPAKYPTIPEITDEQKETENKACHSTFLNGGKRHNKKAVL